MANEHSEDKYSTKVVALETEFKIFEKTVTQSLDRLSIKFDEYIERSSPKQLGLAAIISVVASFFGILAVGFAGLLYLINSQIAPISATQVQILQALQKTNTSTVTLNSDVQLANKEITVVKNKAEANQQTLQWMLFDENIPKQLTLLQAESDGLVKSLDTLKLDVEKIKEKTK